MKTQKFKQTDIGPVPADWEVKPIEELGCLSGAGVDKKSRPDEKRVRLVNYLDVLHKSRIWNRELDFWVTASDKKIEQCDVKKGDVFFTPSSEMPFDIAFSAVAMEDMPRVCYSYHIYRLRILEDIDLDFRAYLFDTRTFYRQAEFLCEGSGKRYVISLAKFRTMKVAFPPSLSEQRAIAEVLSDADEMLATLDKLIEKKRAIKTGAMQQLLSGKKRLPGFSKSEKKFKKTEIGPVPADWEVRQLGDCGIFSKGRGISRSQVGTGNLPCVRYGEIYTDYNDFIREFKSYISEDIAAFSTQLKDGDILFASSGETKEEIGKAVAYLGGQERVFCGGDIIVFSPHSAYDPKFLGYLLNTKIINDQKSSRGQGDAVVHIRGNDLAGVYIPCPLLSEQRAIAEVLSSMDGEIEALLREREKYARIKQGMMRELLTGTTRLEVRQ